MKKISTIIALFVAVVSAWADTYTDRGVICTDEQDTLHLHATQHGDYYVWYINGEPSPTYTDSAIVCPVQTGAQTCVVKTCEIHLDPQRNLMDNGDFENGNDGKFVSSYTYYDYPANDGNFYDSHPNYKNLYTITSNANKFWRDFLAIPAHGGSKYALFDAGDGGYAWKTSTDINPNLQIVKDSVYGFSFWVACPNAQQYFGTGAELQFVICWKDTNGVIQPEVNLGPSYKTKAQTNLSKAWVQVSANWTAPVDASWVQIGVYDKTTGVVQGNDFCLDDIMFQKVAMRTDSVACADTITYYGKDCRCTGEPMYQKWGEVVFVSNTDTDHPYTSYQWYVDSVAIVGATDQYYRFSADQLTKPIYCEMTCQEGNITLYKHTCAALIADIPESHLSNNASSTPPSVQNRRTWQLGPSVQIVQTFYSDGSTDTQKIVRVY